MSNRSRPLIKIEEEIYLIRGQRVMLDTDLAKIYGVSTRRLNEQLRRNLRRFPKDFAFRLTAREWRNLMSQIATSSLHGGRRKLPWALTEHGAIMLEKREIGFHARESAETYRMTKRNSR